MRFKGVGVAIAVALLVTACGGASQDTGSESDKAPFAIAAMADLAGNTASVGQSAMNGIRAAIEGANRRGGVNGAQVELTTRSDDNTQATAVSTVRQLMSEDATLALIGLNSSAIVAAVAPLMDGFQAPLIALGSPPDLLDPPTDYIFNAVTDVGTQGKAQIRFVAENKGNFGIPASPRVGLLHFDSPAAISWTDQAQAEAAAQNIDIVEEQGFALGASDLASQANRLAQSDVDVVVAFLIPSQVSLAIAALESAGIAKDVPVVEYSFGASTDTLTAAGDHAYLAMTNFNATTSSPLITQMLDDADAIEVSATEGSFVDGYGLGLITLDVLDRCGDGCDRASFLEELLKTDSDLGGFAFNSVQYDDERRVAITEIGFQQLGPDGQPELVGDPIPLG